MAFLESHEKCGVFGVYGKGMEVARLTFFGLFALQHRGQESAGIVTSNGDELLSHKKMGLVSQAFREEDINYLKGFSAVGHVRYSTSRESTPEHCQPVIREDNLVALAHNGNLPSTRVLEEFLSSKNIDTSDSNDSEMMTDAIRYYLLRGASLEDAIRESYPLFTGAFSLLVMTRDKLAAVRDQCGIRPLSMAKLNGGTIFASETCATDTIGATLIRDVKPGEMVVADENGIHAEQLVEPNQKLDIFEFVYFARPESMLLGQRVNEVRRNLGVILYEENPIDGDIVVPVPDSAIPAAIGFAHRSGIPFDIGLIKNRYIHRTFIKPGQRFREREVELKLNPLLEVLGGKSVIVVDDSIVRGTTSSRIVEMIRSMGAKRVHLMISSPPITYPDFYGIDTPRQYELIASKMTLDEIKNSTGADSLNYQSYNGLIKATRLPEEYFSASCFTGVYPIDIGERAKELLLPV